MNEGQPKLTILPRLAQRAFAGNTAEFDAAVVEHSGIIGGVKEAIKRVGGKVESDFQDDATKEVLSSGPVIVIAEHAERSGSPALLAALPDRQDAYVIGSANLLHIMGPEAQKYYIPTHIDTHATDSPLSKLWRKINPPTLSSEQAAVLNMGAIRTAIERVQQGGLIVLFPDGTKSNDDWATGLGVLLRKSPEAQVVMASIHGTTPQDPLRLLPGVRMIAPFHAQVIFSEPISAQSIIDEAGATDRKTITQTAQRKYTTWSSKTSYE